MTGTCRFCRDGIDPKKTRIMRKSKYSYVALAYPRLVKGHLLVIPKRHVERISELNNEELIDIMALTRKYCEKVLSFSKGYTVRNNYMPFLTETERKVNHMHIQIIPRGDSDKIYAKSITLENTLFERPSKEEIEDVIKRLK